MTSIKAVPVTWPAEILSFWFGELDPKDWWNGTAALDMICEVRFFELWEEQKSKAAASFLTDPDTMLASLILFDQMPRNMFRGHPDAYSTDLLAQKIAEMAVDRKMDQKLTAKRRVFVYMPFMHGEDIRLPNRSVAQFRKLGNNEKNAKERRAMIKKFGRFPHRNKILGRQFLPGEQDAMDDGANW